MKYEDRILIPKGTSIEVERRGKKIDDPSRFVTIVTKLDYETNIEGEDEMGNYYFTYICLQSARVLKDKVIDI